MVAAFLVDDGAVAEDRGDVGEAALGEDEDVGGDKIRDGLERVAVEVEDFVLNRPEYRERQGRDAFGTHGR